MGCLLNRTVCYTGMLFIQTLHYTWLLYDDTGNRASCPPGNQHRQLPVEHPVSYPPVFHHSVSMPAVTTGFHDVFI